MPLLLLLCLDLCLLNRSLLFLHLFSDKLVLTNLDYLLRFLHTRRRQVHIRGKHFCLLRAVGRVKVALRDKVFIFEEMIP